MLLKKITASTVAAAFVLTGPGHLAMEAAAQGVVVAPIRTMTGAGGIGQVGSLNLGLNPGGTGGLNRSLPSGLGLNSSLPGSKGLPPVSQVAGVQSVVSYEGASGATGDIIDRRLALQTVIPTGVSLPGASRQPAFDEAPVVAGGLGALAALTAELSRPSIPTIEAQARLDAVFSGSSELAGSLEAAGGRELTLIAASASQRSGTISARFRDSAGGEVVLTNASVENERVPLLRHTSLGVQIEPGGFAADLTPALVSRFPARLDLIRFLISRLKSTVSRSSLPVEKEQGSAVALVGRMELLERELTRQAGTDLLPPEVDLTAPGAMRAQETPSYAPSLRFSAGARHQAELTLLKTFEGPASTVHAIQLKVFKGTSRDKAVHVLLDKAALEKDPRAVAAARRLLAGLRLAASRRQPPAVGGLLDEAIWFLEGLEGTSKPIGRVPMPAIAALPAAAALPALSPLLAGPLIGATVGLALGWLVWKLKPNKTNKERWYPGLTLFPNAVMGAFWGLVLAPVYQAGSLSMTLATGAVMLAAQLWMNLSPIRRRATMGL